MNRKIMHEFEYFTVILTVEALQGQACQAAGTFVSPSLKPGDDINLK